MLKYYFYAWDESPQYTHNHTTKIIVNSGRLSSQIREYDKNTSISSFPTQFHK